MWSVFRHWPTGSISLTLDWTLRHLAAPIRTLPFNRKRSRGTAVTRRAQLGSVSPERGPSQGKSPGWTLQHAPTACILAEIFHTRIDVSSAFQHVPTVCRLTIRLAAKRNVPLTIQLNASDVLGFERSEKQYVSSGTISRLVLHMSRLIRNHSSLAG